MSVIIMILLIGLLILVHELGHLRAALLFKVKVDKFGIGLPIGPTLWEKQVGGITLVVHAFLFGGYVSFPDDDKDSDLPQNSPDRLMNKPIWLCRGNRKRNLCVCACINNRTCLGKSAFRLF